MLLFNIIYLSRQWPTPSAPSFFYIGEINSSATIDIFIDPLCADCANQYASAIYALIVKDYMRIQFRFRFLAHPSQTFSFKITKLLFAVNSLSKDQGFALLHRLLTGDYKLFMYQQMLETSVSDATIKMIKWASENTNIDYDIIKSKYDDVTTEVAARTEFKYSLLHNVYSTPVVHINGVLCDLNEQSTIADWEKVINPFLSV